MSVPGVVQESLGDESVAAEVSLGGEDRLFVTPSRTLIYRAEGLLSDESVEEYGHDAEKLTVSEGRRKTRISLEYPLEGVREFTIPSKRADEALHPVIAGVLNGAGVTDPGETVVKTYRFSELTVIVTSQRLVKHIGEAVWDEDYEEFHYGDLTGLSFEEGSVATQVVMEIDGRQQRIKAPNDQARDLQERLKQAVFAYHEVGSMDELAEKVTPEEEETDDGGVEFGAGVDPLGADPDTEADEDDFGDWDDPDESAFATAPGEGGESNGATGGGSTGTHASSAERRSADGRAAEPRDDADESRAGDVASAGADGETDRDLEAAGFEPADQSTADLAEELAELRATVERQNALLAKQQDTIEQLVEELRRGR